MISKSGKFIFVHNPKCAGSMLKNLILKHVDDATDFDWHYSVSELRIKANQSQDYFVFSFCRHPLDRFVSAFTYNLGKSNIKDDYHWKYYAHAYAILQKHYTGDVVNSFRSLVLSDDLDSLLEKECPVHFKPQSHFLCVNDAENVDFIGRFENLEPDIKTILKRIGLPQTDDVSRVNSSNNIPFVEFYDSESELRVKQKYHKDFEIFGYRTLASTVTKNVTTLNLNRNPE